MIDEQIFFREGLIDLFRSTIDFVVVGPAGSVHQGKELTLLHKLNIVQTDFSLPDGTGLDATRHYPALVRLQNHISHRLRNR